MGFWQSLASGLDDATKFQTRLMFGGASPISSLDQVNKSIKQETGQGILGNIEQSLNSSNRNNPVATQSNNVATPMQQMNSQRDSSSDQNMNTIDDFIRTLHGNGYIGKVGEENRQMTMDEIRQLGQMNFDLSTKADAINHGQEKEIIGINHGNTKELRNIDFGHRTKERDQVFAIDMAMNLQDHENIMEQSEGEWQNKLNLAGVEANAQLQTNYMDNMVQNYDNIMNALRVF